MKYILCLCNIASRMKLKVFLLLVFLINLLQGIYTPIIDDEAYYWMWSLRLDTGYFDHPPMIAIWIKLSDLFLDGEIGARLITIFFNTITALLFWKTVNPTSRKERNIFFITYFSLVLIQVFSWVSTPDAPLLFFTVFYLYVLKVYLNKQTIVSTTLLGICFAGLMYSKYHGILVIFFTLVPLLGFVLRKSSFYLAVVLSLILYTPHFLWLYENDFPPVSYHFIDRSAEQKFSFIHPITYIVTALLSAAGLLVVFLGNALKRVDQKDLFQRAIFWLAIGPFFFFLISTLKDTTQVQWLLISYIACGFLLYWYIVSIKNLKWFYITGLTTAGLIGIARVVIMIPEVSPFHETKKFGKLAGELVTEDVIAFEKYQEASIFQFYNRDKRGVVYRTLGNRSSQFNLWDDESLLNQPFNYVTPWMESKQSFKGLKGKEYYINRIENYSPIHRSRIEFLNVKEQPIDLKQNEIIDLTIQLNDFDIQLLKAHKVGLSLFITKDQQYNIVDDVNIPLENWSNIGESKDGFMFNISYRIPLEPGNYTAYIGITPSGLIAKYQSKPLKIIVTE